jgi:hypothetical protein
MKMTNISLRSLQAISIISALIAITGGGTFMLNGVDGVALVVSSEYPELKPLLQLAAADIDAASRVTFDHWYRVLGWYWLVTGLMLLWIIPNVQHNTAWFRLIHLSFMAVGLSSLLSIMEYGTNVHNRYGAVIIELSVPSLLMLWQWYEARKEL